MVGIVAEDVQNLKLNQSQQKREAVLQWISPLNFAPKQSELSSRRQEGTGTWLLNSKKFKQWKMTEGSTLVCQGIPGAGRYLRECKGLKRLVRLTISRQDNVNFTRNRSLAANSEQ